MRWWTPPGADRARVARLVERALAAVAAGAEDTKDGRRKALYLLALEGEDADFLLKVNRYDRAGRPRLRAGKSRRELAIALALSARDIDVPLPLAAGEQRRRGRVSACYLLVPRIPGARDLAQLAAGTRAPARLRRARCAALGRLARHLHDAGLLQRDFAPNNFLATCGSERVLPIDFERASLRRRVSRSARGAMLARLERGCGRTSATLRLRFLQAYAGGDREGARAWWRALALEGARLARADHVRLRRTGVRAGRRFEPVTLGSWCGIVRRAPGARDLVAADLPRAARDAEASVTALPAAWCVCAPGADAASTWASALLLWRRGLGPPPLACLARGGALRLWLAREPGSRTLAARPGDARGAAAARALLARLASLGRCADVDPERVALRTLSGGRLEARLLDPGRFAPRAAGTVGRRRLRYGGHGRRRPAAPAVLVPR